MEVHFRHERATFKSLGFKSLWPVRDLKFFLQQPASDLYTKRQLTSPFRPCAVFLSETCQDKICSNIVAVNRWKGSLEFLLLFSIGNLGVLNSPLTPGPTVFGSSLWSCEMKPAGPVKWSKKTNPFPTSLLGVFCGMPASITSLCTTFGSRWSQCPPVAHDEAVALLLLGKW